jgi:hypothetical protein
MSDFDELARGEATSATALTSCRRDMNSEFTGSAAWAEEQTFWSVASGLAFVALALRTLAVTR